MWINQQNIYIYIVNEQGTFKQCSSLYKEGNRPFRLAKADEMCQHKRCDASGLQLKKVEALPVAQTALISATKIPLLEMYS